MGKGLVAVDYSNGITYIGRPIKNIDESGPGGGGEFWLYEYLVCSTSGLIKSDMSFCGAVRSFYYKKNGNNKNHGPIRIPAEGRIVHILE